MSRVALFGGIGDGNASPVYQPELFRFNGVKPLPSTAARTVPRERQLEHPGHTPAVPLDGRSIPAMEPWQIPLTPHLICFNISAVALSTEYHISPRIGTPSVLTMMIVNVVGIASYVGLQMVLASDVIATDAQILASPKIFTYGPEAADRETPLRAVSYVSTNFQESYPLNYHIPNGPRNRVVLRIRNADPSAVLTLRVQIHVQPL